MFLPVDYFANRLFRRSIISPVDVLGQKVDIFIVDVLKVDVLEVVQMGRPGFFRLSPLQTEQVFMHRRSTCLDKRESDSKFFEEFSS